MPAWRGRFAGQLAVVGATTTFHDSGEALAKALADDWSVDLVIVDLALAVPALGARLTATGPRLIAFGEPANAGLALAANLVDFIPAEPADDELAAVVAAAFVPAPALGVADLSNSETGRLAAMGSEAERIAAALARLEPAGDAALPPLDATRLRGAIKARRARDTFFPAAIFGEPAWDMLLDLAVAAAEARDTAVSSLCIAAAVPTTTALRWIRTLCDAGLFERRDDPADARRAFISLSPGAMQAMAHYLAQTPA